MQRCHGHQGQGGMQQGTGLRKSTYCPHVQIYSLSNDANQSVQKVKLLPLGLAEFTALTRRMIEATGRFAGEPARPGRGCPGPVSALDPLAPPFVQVAKASTDEDSDAFTIAIDDRAASGKGTVAGACAAFRLSSSGHGLLYRAVGAKGGDPVEAARSLAAADLDHAQTCAAPRPGRPPAASPPSPEVRGAGGVSAQHSARREPGAVPTARHRHRDLAPWPSQVLHHRQRRGPRRPRRRWNWAPS